MSFLAQSSRDLNVSLIGLVAAENVLGEQSFSSSIIQ